MIRMRTVVLAVLAVVLFDSGVAFAAQPPSNLMAPVRTLLAVTDGRSNVNLDTLFTPDGVVIDESAPYLWSGPHAASQWWAHVHGQFVAMHMRGFNAAAGPPIEYSQTGARAYLILPMTLSGTGLKPFREKGTLTFTFRRIVADWKISSEVWTTALSR
jgi:hypothetical protein